MSVPPEVLLLSLNRSIPCRELQIRQLAALFAQNNLSTLVIHGAKATGKTLTIRALLDSIDTPSTIVRSQECITTRHLLERTLSSAKHALRASGQDDGGDRIDGRCESISAFVVDLQILLEGKRKFILVFDGIDRQREVAPTLLPAIARLGEFVKFPGSACEHPVLTIVRYPI